MKVSKKSDYALRALFYLVDHSQDGPISISELAERNDLPKRFLEHIMLDLKSQGWVRSAPGKNGGYELAKQPDSISIGRVIRFFDALLAPINCVSVSTYERCSQELTCRFRRMFLDIRNETTQVMDRLTLENVNRCEPVPIWEVFDELLMEGAGI
jgi:Rrf2 family protein